jgi:tRNA G10  N-methylase Trm11
LLKKKFILKDTSVEKEIFATKEKQNKYIYRNVFYFNLKKKKKKKKSKKKKEKRTKKKLSPSGIDPRTSRVERMMLNHSPIEPCGICRNFAYFESVLSQFIYI